jgi:hypothetical protein
MKISLSYPRSAPTRGADKSLGRSTVRWHAPLVVVLGQVVGEVQWGGGNEVRGWRTRAAPLYFSGPLARLAKRRLNFIRQVIGWAMAAFVGTPGCLYCSELGTRTAYHRTWISTNNTGLQMGLLCVLISSSSSPRPGGRRLSTGAREEGTPLVYDHCRNSSANPPTTLQYLYMRGSLARNTSPRTISIGSA